MNRTATPHDGTSGRVVTKPVLAWALWDWGSAAFNAVITTFVFTVYLTSSAFGDTDTTSTALSHGLLIAGLVIALLAPVTGQRADRAGRGALHLAIDSAFVFAASAALFLIRPEPAYLWAGVALVAFGNIAFEFASVHYNAMLPRISTPRTIGRVSGFGWGAGYLGGIVLLLVLLVGFISPTVGWFGVTADDGLNVRAAMLVSAAWFGLSALPVLISARRGAIAAAPTPHARSLGLVDSYKALWGTVVGLGRSHRDTLLFLIASAIFRDGLAGVFTFGGVIAAGSYGFTAQEVIIFGVVANVVAGIATIAFGVLDDVLGPKRVIVLSLVCMIAAGLAVFALHDAGPWAFWTFGLALCVFVGPAQSASRSFLARVIPTGREGEIFGLYATTGRAVSFLAPAGFGLAIGLGGLLTPTGQSAQHWGILGIMVVLLAGLLLLLPVRPAPQTMT